MDLIDETQYFLKQGVKIDFLACRWIAWTHLIGPVQHAFNLAYRQLPMLESFCDNPAVHAGASQDPEYFAGHFIPFSETEVPELRRLLERTRQDCAPLIQFARDFRRFSRHLQTSANGHVLDELYSQLPESLKGLVELGYDVSHRPHIRVIEELVYNSGPRNTHTQEVALSEVADENRGFFLNTPMLEVEHLGRKAPIILEFPFADPRLDLLFSMRIRSASLADLARTLELGPVERLRMNSMLTTEPPRRQTPDYDGDDVRFRYFGHACILLQTSTVAVLVDPLLAFDANETDGRFTFADLPDFIDYVVITHNHQDHFVPEILLQLRGRIGTIAVPGSNPWNPMDQSMSLLLRKLGFRGVVECNLFDTMDIDGGSITTIPFPGEHAGLDVESKQGISIKLCGHHFLLVADADCVDRALYRRTVEVIGKVDTLFIGMECDGAPLSWLYGPYLTRPPNQQDDQSRRLCGAYAERAWNVVEEIGCERVFVYAMGQEPWVRHLLGLAYEPGCKQLTQSDVFVGKCRANSVAAERLYCKRELVFRTEI